MILAISFKRVQITKKVYNVDTTITNAFDIFCINRTIIQDIEIDYTKEEIKLLEYVKDNINLKENKILILGNPRQEFWFDGFFEYANREDLETYIPYDDVFSWNSNQKFKYLIVFYRSYAFDEYKDKIDYKTKLFENESGAIYVNDL